MELLDEGAARQSQPRGECDVSDPGNAYGSPEGSQRGLGKPTFIRAKEGMRLTETGTHFCLTPSAASGVSGKANGISRSSGKEPQAAC